MATTSPRRRTSTRRRKTNPAGPRPLPPVAAAVCRAGRLVCPETTTAARAARCRACPQYAAPRSRCGANGAYVRRRWRLPREHCPRGQW